MAYTQNLMEQETIVRWDRTPEKATVYTSSEPMMRQLVKKGYQMKPTRSRDGIVNGWEGEVDKNAFTFRKVHEDGSVVKRAAPLNAFSGQSAPVQPSSNDQAGEVVG